MTMMTFEDWKAGRRTLSVEDAAKELGAHVEDFGDADAVEVYPGGCVMTQQAGGAYHHLHLGRDEYLGSVEQLEPVLYANWYVSECEPATTLDELSILYRWWCGQQRVPHMSADELIHEEAITPEQHQWLSWFIDRWVSIEG